MDETEKTLHIKLSDYHAEGLYLLPEDQTQETIVLTRDTIEKIANEFWNDPNLISPDIKNAAEFQRCSFCPLKRKGDLCTAIRPVLPLVKKFNNWLSYEKITGVYYDGSGEIVYISETDKQSALKLISILSLMNYCDKGKTYWKFFMGLIPLMNGKDFARRLYLNIYWLHRGDKKNIDTFISEFRDVITATSQNQVKRLNMICKGDALLNAFVNTQIITEILSMDMEKAMGQAFGSKDAGFE